MPATTAPASRPLGLRRSVRALYPLASVARTGQKHLADHALVPALARVLVYPLQTLACAGMMFLVPARIPPRHDPARRTDRSGCGRAGLRDLDFSAGVLPFHAAHPGRLWTPPPSLSSGHSAYGLTVALRFLRLAVVVPWLEEIFWRGFLLRFLIKEDFLSLPFGAWTPLSFGVVVLGFTFEHGRPDWPGRLRHRYPL